MLTQRTYTKLRISQITPKHTHTNPYTHTHNFFYSISMCICVELCGFQPTILPTNQPPIYLLSDLLAPNFSVEIRSRKTIHL